MDGCCGKCASPGVTALTHVLGCAWNMHVDDGKHTSMLMWTIIHVSILCGHVGLPCLCVPVFSAQSVLVEGMTD